MDDPPPLHLSFTFQGSLASDLIILFILIVFSGLVSGAEIAFFSISQKDTDKLSEEKLLSSKLVVLLLAKSKRLLATILILNNTINIGIVLFFGSADFFAHIEDVIWFGFISSKFLIEIVLIAFLILIFGEIIPKVFASNHSISFARFMSWPLYVLDFIFRPLSEPLQRMSQYMQKHFGKEKTNISVGQLSHAIDMTSKSDTTRQEKKMLKGIVAFGHTETKQIMKPRIDIFAINEKMKFLDVIQAVIKSNFSRIPIYTESSDDIIGLLYSKDLLEHLDKNNFDWITLKRDAYFIPENKKLDDLLNEFQQKKIHLAIVVDEYGGTSGLVTLEDVIEEIVGEISDEFDEKDTSLYTKIDNYTFIFEGKTMLRDFYKLINLDEKSENIFETYKGESETLAGFVLEISGLFPKKKDKFFLKNYSFEILEIDNKRIKEIKITIPNV